MLYVCSKQNIINEYWKKEFGKKYQIKVVDIDFFYFEQDFSNNDILIFSDYTADGYRIATLDLSTNREIASRVNPTPFRYPIDRQVTDSTFVLENEVMPDSSYQATKYSRLKHLFNIHPY